MKFGQAIDSVLFKNYFNLEGKATRSEYWWFMLFFLIFNLFAGIVVGIVVGITYGADFNPDTFSLYYTLGLLALFILPLLGLSVRRFADAGRGKREAIVVFVLAMISQLIVPMGAQGAIIQVAEFLIMPAWIVLGATTLYTLYIALKKSV
jgi:uncharacterized membrane protein YhaH (DUF805 family)|tara:strand:+ start:13 stop:462 length:450 start_codon:yes stop_codon:yes gene_type:complete